MAVVLLVYKFDVAKGKFTVKRFIHYVCKKCCTICGNVIDIAMVIPRILFMIKFINPAIRKVRHTVYIPVINIFCITFQFKYFPCNESFLFGRHGFGIIG